MSNQTKKHRGVFGVGIFLLAAMIVFQPVAGVQAAPTVVTYGPFTVSFYNNGDSDAYLTGAQDWTADQMADVGAAIQAWDQMIENTPGRQLSMHVFWRELDVYGSNVLGGSGSHRVADGSTIWNLGEYVWKKGLNPGTTPDGLDTLIQYDVTAAGLSWNFGAGAPGAGQIDFRSVVTHEIGHSLGFDTSYDAQYDDFGWLNDAYGYYGLTAWDSNLVDGDGDKPPAGGGSGSDFNHLDDPVYWDGANAVAYHGDLVPIYAPDPWQEGSSLSHLDESALPDALMSPSIGTAQSIREPTELEWMMMKDMGWDIVPEPGTVALVCVGGLITLIRRRRTA